MLERTNVCLSVGKSMTIYILYNIIITVGHIPVEYDCGLYQKILNLLILSYSKVTYVLCTYPSITGCHEGQK